MNTLSKKPHVIIVGAGLAGLATAYELLKTGNYTVEIFEELDRVGGRVHSLPVHGEQVDFGGFIIYPWYEMYRRLINELNIAAHLEPIPIKDILYEIDTPNEYILEDDIKFPATDTVKLWAKSAPSILMNADIAKPRLDTYYDKTISQYLRETLGRPEHAGMYETFMDVVSQGYCYGPADQYRAAFVTPIIRYTKLYGDIRSAFYFRNGNTIFPNALTKYIKSRGGVIHLSESVIDIEGQTIKTAKNTYTADSIVFAQRITDQLFSKVLPTVNVSATYTEYYAAALEFTKTPKINNSADWGGIFYKPTPKMPYQILSAINVGLLYSEKLASCITVNIRVLPEHTNDLQPLTATELYNRIKTEIAERFPEAECTGIEAVVHWPQTMPIVTEDFVRAVRAQQGKPVFFAGDYLGGPSMETALQTGMNVVRAIQAQYEI